MPDFTQDHKAGRVTTILGKDKLLLEKFTATESLGSPFEIVLEALSVDGEIDFTPHLGTGVSITAAAVDSATRDFHGLLFEALCLGPHEGLTRYRLTLRPWLSLLDLGQDSKIFQGDSVKTIITSIFADFNVSDYDFAVQSAGLKTREYCVQYKESAFTFISRLMEEEGIYYYFKHTDSKHTMVLCDDPVCHAPAALAVPVARGDADRTGSYLWTWGKRVRPGLMKATLRDSNLYLPGQTLEAKAEDTSKNSAEKAEFYDYPGGYAYHAANGSETGDSYVKARLQAGRRDREMYVGQGNVFPLATGARVGLNDPDLEDDKAVEYLITTSTHTFSGQTYAGAHVDGELETIVDFEGLLADLNWRPARVTPKSVMTGPQPATVVGKAGEVIDVDQYGRVRVQFDWDRIGTKDEKSSCWLRVSQSSAGSNLGHMVIPRIGEEVLVDFLDGDPDRPIITGRVYNATNMPPYVLPDNKTKSTWKSQTVGDSGDYNGAEEPPSGKGFNEIRFEDKGPSEEFFIHAQRIFNSWIRLDETRKTGRDTTVRVGRDRKVAIRNNETVTIEDGSRSTTIKQNDTLELQSGNYSMKIDSGTATIEAAQSITLKVAGNKIVVDTQGIHISGTLIELKAEGPLSAQGLKTDLKADTMMTIGGALVKIN